MDEHGYFFFIADEDEYVFSKITREITPEEKVQVFPPIYFHVPSGSKVIYIGTLQIDYVRIQDFKMFVEDTEINSVKIIDEFENA
ncbi:MAG: hypothetical protein GTO02_10070, partial [Candidatus Dadabacteria bacterium]|nr:hypothetical protein [Candidatus Dadabacteria bacterium]